MSNLNTAEYDARGRCVRHPAIRLRKKKLLGGWKVIIGHCPECCLDEMRRVRDQIDANTRSDDENPEGLSERELRRKKKKKKKGGSRSSHSDRESRHKKSSSGRSRGSKSGHSAPLRGGEGGSEATGSTKQETISISSKELGEGSVQSEQIIPTDFNFQYAPNASTRHTLNPEYRLPAPPQGGERTMVLSMAFTDRTTGYRGSYTGQIDTATGQPDGKGTVYYNDGSISEGSWCNGVLVDDGYGNSNGNGDGGEPSYGYQDQRAGDGGYGSDTSRTRGRAPYQPSPRSPQQHYTESSQERYSGGYTSEASLSGRDGGRSSSRGEGYESSASRSRRHDTSSDRSVSSSRNRDRSRSNSRSNSRPTSRSTSRSTSRGPSSSRSYQNPSPGCSYQEGGHGQPSPGAGSYSNGGSNSNNYMPGSLSDLDRLGGASKPRGARSVRSTQSRNSYGTEGSRSRSVYSEAEARGNNGRGVPPPPRSRGTSFNASPVYHQSSGGQPHYNSQGTMDP